MKWIAAHRMMLLGFAVAVAYWPTMLSAAFMPRWAAIAIGLPLASRLDPRDLRPSVAWVLLWLLTVAAIATTWASPDPLAGYEEMIFMGLLCLALVAGANLDNADEVMIGAGFGLALSVFGILFAMNADEGRTVYASTSGLFYNSEVFAEFSAIIFVWALLRPRYLIAAIALVPILICESRIALVIAAAAMLYAFGPRSRLKMAVLVVLLVVVAASLVFILGPGKAGTAGQRAILWISTFYAWTQFGHGLGWFATVHSQEQFAHSEVLQTVAELGIGGVAALLIPVLALSSKRGNHAERAAFVAVCFECAVSFPLHLPANGFLAAVLAGVLLSRRPVVLMGGDHVAVADGAGVQQREAAYRAVAVAGRSGGGAVPSRSGSAPLARLRAHGNFVDSPALGEG